MTTIDGYARDEQTGIEMVRSAGGVFTKGGKEFSDLRASYLDGELETVIAGAKKRRVKDPQKIIDAFRANVAKWEKLLAGKTRDTATFQALLKEHVYDRIDPAKL